MRTVFPLIDISLCGTALKIGSCRALPWEFRAGCKGRAEHDVSSRAAREVATTEPPPLSSLLHQVRNRMRVIEDRSGRSLPSRAVHTL